MWADADFSYSIYYWGVHDDTSLLFSFNSNSYSRVLLCVPRSLEGALLQDVHHGVDLGRVGPFPHRVGQELDGVGRALGVDGPARHVVPELERDRPTPAWSRGRVRTRTSAGRT
jgi:hypothetical protein